MPDFVEIAPADRIPPGSGARFIAADKDIAIFNVDGTICAIADTCPHAGGSLGMGKLEGKIVTCPVHGMSSTSPTDALQAPRTSGSPLFRRRL
jgi:nitrite reductase/ring-hydroxylating ferredoxin subunit